MFTRLKSFSHIYRKNKNLIFKLFGVSLFATGLVFYKKSANKSHVMREAYDKFSLQIKSRNSHHRIQSLFYENCKITYLNPIQPDFFKQKSLEATVLLDARFYGAPLITNDDGSKSELNSLEIQSWEEFIDTASDDITISFGHRKAFNENLQLPFTHAVLYVVDSTGRHSIFGYNANYNNFIINDSSNAAVSRLYTLYPELTINGNKSQAKQLFAQIEDYSKQPYTVISCNCYSPLISGLLEAKKLGFHVPNGFNDSLLIVIPYEQNYGMGVTSNRYLGPLVETAINRSHQFFEKMKKQATEKFHEISESKFVNGVKK